MVYKDEMYSIILHQKEQYRKTSSISRDLYQKLNLKNYQVISQS